MTQRRPPCPLCLSKDILRIQYGMPSDETLEKSSAGKLVLGGCCISDQSPKWYCQACEHEFGKFMPSDEDVLNPEPDGIKPLGLEFWIGGYSGPNHSVKLVNGVLKYELHEHRYQDSPVKELEIIPTHRKWLNFRKKLDEIDVWQWKHDYPNPGVCDGTQWELEIDYGVKKKNCSGDNAYPGWEGIKIVDDATVMKDDPNEFDAFLHALKLLLGGVKIN